MSLIDKIYQLERLDAMIRRKGTGAPKQLARRMNTSERNIYNLINLMKELGASVYFCKYANSYCYEENVKFQVGFILNDEMSVKGGNNKITMDYFEVFDHCKIFSVGGATFG